MILNLTEEQIQMLRDELRSVEDELVSEAKETGTDQADAIWCAQLLSVAEKAERLLGHAEATAEVLQGEASQAHEYADYASTSARTLEDELSSLSSQLETLREELEVKAALLLGDKLEGGE